MSPDPPGRPRAGQWLGESRPRGVDPSTPGTSGAKGSPCLTNTIRRPLRDTASIMFQIGEFPPTGSKSGYTIAALRVNS